MRADPTAKMTMNTQLFSAKLSCHASDSQNAADAIHYAIESLSRTRRSIESASIILSERQQLEMNQMLRCRLDHYLDCCLNTEIRSDDPIEQIVVWKGATLVRQRGVRLAANDASVADQFKLLQNARRSCRYWSTRHQIRKIPTSGKSKLKS